MYMLPAKTPLESVGGIIPTLTIKKLLLKEGGKKRKLSKRNVNYLSKN